MAYRLAELAELVGGRTEGDGERSVAGIASLENASSSEISFVSNPKYKQAAAESQAGALLVNEPLPDVERDYLVVDNPYLALSKLLQLYHPAAEASPGIDRTAIVDDTARVDPTASIGPYSVVGPRSSIGAESRLGPHVVIGQDCAVGERSVIYPRVVLYDGTQVGNGCILHAGVILGSDGFGFAQAGGRHHKLAHVGHVVVEDDVEIGANSTVDRALMDETRIGAGSKIDNLVQVAHNVRLGRGCLLVSQSGIAGSSHLGDGVVVAGQSGISGHLKLGDGVQVAAKSAVFKSVDGGKTVAGIPAIDAATWRRQQAIAAKLDRLRKRLIELEKSLVASSNRESESD